MGLFSKLSKNKQESAGEDSGHYTRAEDQAATERARSKRASSAGGKGRSRADAEAADPVLPEKKRARRRLVGAIALALAVAVGLPMVLDSEPKPLSSDIDIKIPSKDKSGELPAAAAVAASAALDNTEEIVSVPAKATPAKPAPAVAESKPAAEPKPVAEAKPAAEPKPAAAEAKLAPAKVRESLPVAELPKAEVKPPKAEVKAEAKAEAKPEHKQEAKAEPKLEAKAEARQEHKADAKPAKDDAKSGDDAARAMAILEGKPSKPAEAAGQKYVLQVAALTAQDKVDELQEKLRGAGIKSFTQKVPTQSGERTRVRVGPFSSKEEAEKVRAKLARMGLNGSLVPV
ncbi:SPOR domain-containing protein [Rugamonas apoptosis]|uniref:SPOR domain-containing protein n=1 Tax=Rugamonas apoptosis TaxID=2758570 RepID=A0A7W2F6Y3_9BURK|nr:SPOR domain-containing protein [Rugamonas apoptosis]MBA5686246.1 SPOR domain-containing protein [Rugamonas apoptosis]